MAATAQPNQRRVRLGRDRRGGGVHLVRVVGVVVIADLARARVSFQQRTILMILEEKPMTRCANTEALDAPSPHLTRRHTRPRPVDFILRHGVAQPAAGFVRHGN